MAKRFPWYPIFIDVEDHDVVIIGGGEVCARKAETMMRYGARVTVVSPAFTPEIETWANEGKLALRRKRYEPGDLDGASIVIASTDDTAVNEQVAADCRRRRIPVNVVDVTPLCEFIVPAIVEKGSVTLAVSTGGKSPALARTLKEDLQRRRSQALLRRHHRQRNPGHAARGTAAGGVSGDCGGVQGGGGGGE